VAVFYFKFNFDFLTDKIEIDKTNKIRLYTNKIRLHQIYKRDSAEAI
jgi:hypothetical protein